MKVLVACEFSGIVREAFAKRWHDSWSCDLLPTEIPSDKHFQKDIRIVLKEVTDWDLLIAHPPCTYLAVSGARWFKGRKMKQQEALDFVRLLMEADIPKICIENPISVISTRIRKPDQIIQPWMFGHEESKATCLWLRNLPPLKPTKIMKVRNRNLTPSGQNKIGPSCDRWKKRSRTYIGVGEAMADQWGRERR